MSLPYTITSPCHITGSPGDYIFDDGTNQITIQASNSISFSYTLTLPENDGDSGQYLYSDGTGITFWGNIPFILSSLDLGVNDAVPATFTTGSTTYFNITTFSYLGTTRDFFAVAVFSIDKSDIDEAEYRIAKNGTLVPGSFRRYNSSSSGVFNHASTQCLVTLTSGDDIALQIRNGAGSTNSLSYNNSRLILIQY